MVEDLFIELIQGDSIRCVCGKRKGFLEMAHKSCIKAGINPDLSGIGDWNKKIRGFVPIGREPDNRSLQSYHLSEQFPCPFGIFCHSTKSYGVFTIRKPNPPYLVLAYLCIQNP